MTKKIIFTGGHHNSTLEIAKTCRDMGYQVVWIGHKFASKGDKSFSAEYQEVTASGIKFLELKTGKFYRRLSIVEIIKIVLGFFQSGYYLLKERPGLIFSSGGYLSVPVVIVGWLFRIPSLTHEQTVVAGWANKAISPFVDKILLTHQSSLDNYPKEKSFVVGLPLRKEILNLKNRKKYTPPLIYITCGKQGSHLINQAVFPIIPKLVENFTVVHQTGANTLTKDIDRARRVKDRLGKLHERYHYAPYFFAKEAAGYMQSADAVVSRSGAHITYELMYLSKKTVFIPISWVSHNEQLLNAELAKTKITCVILEEKNLSPDSLYQSILKVYKTTRKINPDKLERSATQKIIKAVQEYFPN